MDYKEALASLGTKYFKIKSNDEYEIIRLTSVNFDKSKKDNLVFNAVDENHVTDTYYEKILNTEYTRLIPDGLVTFMAVRMSDGKEVYQDVVISTYTRQTLQSGSQVPDVLLRQNALDIIANDGSVGLCITPDDVDDEDIYREVMHVGAVDNMYGVNVYMNDTIEDILGVLGIKIVDFFDRILEKGFKDYISASSGIDMGQKSTKGHCRDLRTLLENTNYAYNHDMAFHILPVKFDVKPHIIHTSSDDIEYDILDEDLTTELSYLFRKKVTKAIILQYDHDIDVNHLQKDGILFLRTIDGILWIVRIIYDGEFLEKEMDKALLNNFMEDINIVRKYGSKNNKG